MAVKGREFPIIQPETLTSPTLKQAAIIWDLDGCIVDAPLGRVDFNDAPAMNKLMDGHPPNWKLISLMNSFANHQAERPKLVNLICTGRPERYKAVTKVWLERYKVKYHQMWMRLDNDNRPDAEVKLSMLREIEHEFSVWFAVEDRNSVVRMWRDNGILCLQCQDGDF